MLRLCSAELIEVQAGDFDRCVKLRDELSEKNGWFNCNQFDNPLNIKAHAEGTAREIIEFFEKPDTFLEALVTGTGKGYTNGM